jgi:hypothetical protein
MEPGFFTALCIEYFIRAELKKELVSRVKLELLTSDDNRPAGSNGNDCACFGC